MPVTAGTTNRTNLTNEQGNLVQAIVANPDLLKTVLTEIYDYLDANWGDYSTHKTASVLGHPDGSVTGAKLADGSVSTSKITDNAVTTSKIATGALDGRYYQKAETYNKDQTESRIASAYVTAFYVDGGSFSDTYSGGLTGIDGGVWA